MSKENRMNEDLGNQGGFSDVGKMAESFERSSGVFKTSVGKFVFGVGLMKTAVEQMNEQIKTFGGQLINMTGVLRGISGAFAMSQVVDTFSELNLSLYDTRKGLEKTFGLFGDERGKFTDSLFKQSKDLVDYGVNVGDVNASFHALAKEFANAEFARDLAGTAAMFSKGFGVSSEAGA